MSAAATLTCALMPLPAPLGSSFLPVAGADAPLAVFFAAATCAGVDGTDCNNIFAAAAGTDGT
eukprot:7557745-Karenia_brevis.AAC.1